MNVFSLFAKIGLDTKEYEKGLTESKGKFHSFADSLKGAAGKVGDVLAGVGKAAAAGIGAASTAITALSKKSLDAVADFEQLKGGVEKIFNDSAGKVLDYANKAYQTAGLSANQYMETVTSFSASLLQSLDGNTEAAADAANRAIIDMSDNVNTYGSSMESVMNAYQGFSKQNYTMLDNLKLGYGGTKEEMARLIQDASEMNEEMEALGVTVDADSMSFGNIVNAISVMQKHMKIAGTTSAEASRTVSGSIAAMKAAWQNFLTGTGSASSLADAAKTAVKNISGKLTDIVPALTDGLSDLVGELSPEVPKIMNKLLPSVVSGATSLVAGLASSIPAVVSSLAQTVPVVAKTIMSKKDELLKAGKELISSIFPSDVSKIPQLMTSAVSTVTTFAADITDPKNLKTVTDKAFSIINALLNGLTSPDTLSAFMDPENGVIKIIENIGEGLAHFAVNLVSSATQIIKNLGDYLNNEDNRAQLWAAAKDIVTKIGNGLTSKETRDALGGFVLECGKFVADLFIGGIDWDATGGDIAKQLIKGVYNNLWTTKLGTWIGESIEGLANAEEHAWLDSGSTLPLDEFTKTRRDASNSAAYSAITGIPTNSGEYYAQKYGGAHATGFYAKRPTFLTGDWVGENGEEVLLPLDRNDGWADKLAAKIGGGGVHVENINVSVQFAESGDDATIKRVVSGMIGEISEQLADLQSRESRGLGLGYRGGTWA